MTTIEKIKNLLLSKEESKEVKMYAEMILDDGRVLATEDDQFMIGSTVMVVGDDGETSPLGAGTYTMSDGAKLTIDEDSKILDPYNVVECYSNLSKNNVQYSSMIIDWSKYKNFKKKKYL